MFYLIFVFLIVTILFIRQDKKSGQGKYLLLIMTAYLSALFAMLCLLAKDTYYYNTVYSYFFLPARVWKQLMLLSIRKETLIYILNLSCLLVIFFSACFALSFHPFPGKAAGKKLIIILALFLTVEFLFYTPAIERFLYLRLYPEYSSYAGWIKAVHIFHYITCVFNTGFIGISFWLILLAYRKAPPLQIIRRNILAINFCYVLIMLSYFVLFSGFPVCLIKISKLANTTTYLSVPLNQSSVVTQIFPFYVLLTFILVMYNIFRMGHIRKEIAQHTFSLSKKIAASDTTSKVFCHYMKNELLAIHSEAEMLNVAPEDQEYLGDILQRCNNLYNRLNEIHASTKASELFLEPADIMEEIQGILSHLSYELEGIQVECKCEQPELEAMIDREYFAQAIHNIIINAAEALKDQPPKKKKLSITLQSFDNWIVILISDTGRGIAPECLNRIFEPFYSSAPVSRHWGMGLALTYKIIVAHEGQIEAESQPEKGTTIKVMLPRLG